MQLSNITENRSLWKRWCRNLNDATWPEVQCYGSRSFVRLREAKHTSYEAAVSSCCSFLLHMPRMRLHSNFSDTDGTLATQSVIFGKLTAP